jgi:mannosyl-oligosaccharide glucosidase
LEHNTFFVQITLPKTVAGEAFSFDVIYQSDSSDNERQQDLTGIYFNEEILRLQKQFDQRFENIFQLKTKQNMSENKIQFARSTLSNLIGGISYFTGKFSLFSNNKFIDCFVYRSIISSRTKSKNS